MLYFTMGNIMIYFDFVVMAPPFRLWRFTRGAPFTDEKNPARPFFLFNIRSRSAVLVAYLLNEPEHPLHSGQHSDRNHLAYLGQVERPACLYKFRVDRTKMQPCHITVRGFAPRHVLFPALPQCSGQVVGTHI